MSANSISCSPWPAAPPPCRSAGVLAAKPLLGLLGALLGSYISATGPTPIIKLVGIFVVLLGYFIPDLLLYSKGQERQKAMQLELANTLDQMLISVEAGLGFEGAMARAGENGKGPLAEELIRTLQDMQVGRSRRESYVALAERTNIPSCAASSRRSSRRTPTASPSAGCCGSRRKSCGSSAGNGPRKGDEAAGDDPVPAAVLHLPGAVHRHSGPRRHQRD